RGAPGTLGDQRVHLVMPPRGIEGRAAREHQGERNGHPPPPHGCASFFTGTSAIPPHFEHVPGACEVTSGCWGQTHGGPDRASAPFPAFGTSALPPHTDRVPGESEATSGRWG